MSKQAGKAKREHRIRERIKRREKRIAGRIARREKRIRKGYVIY
jgi:hypothetical protein